MKFKYNCRFISLCMTIIFIALCYSPAASAYSRLGDVDNDGYITAADARIALRVSVYLERPSDDDMRACDVDGDNYVTAADAREILRFSVKLSELPLQHPAEQPDYGYTTENDLPANAKVVYLTFDDGPSAQTSKVLNILKQNNVKATFFVVYQPSYASMYKKIVEDGNRIALHSYTHNYAKIYKSTTAYFNDLQLISDYVYNQTGVRTNLIRFPGGSSNTISRNYSKGIMTKLSKLVEQKGYVYFDWNAANNDATGQNLTWQQMYYAAIAPIKRGEKSVVMLMHDSASKSKTVTALPHIIKAYKNAGYYFLTLNENSPTAHHKVAN